MHAPIRSVVVAVLAAALCGCGSPGPAPAAAVTPAATPQAAPAPATPSAATSAPVAPAPVTSSPVAAGRPAPPVVLLDPGHNGGNAAHPSEIDKQVPDGRGGTKPCNTTGTQTNAGYPEHAFTWDLAQKVTAHLEAAGVRVVLTRPDDRGVGPCVDERGAAGARAGAVAAVSLHADGASPSSRGFHVAYADPPVHGTGPASTRLATALRDALRTGRFAPADYIGHDGLDGRGDLAGLNTSSVPTALVEAGNMRNAGEAALLSSDAGRERYATAITNGVLAYLRR